MPRFPITGGGGPAASYLHLQPARFGFLVLYYGKGACAGNGMFPHGNGTLAYHTKELIVSKVFAFRGRFATRRGIGPWIARHGVGVMRKYTHSFFSVNSDGA